jgi:succinoglycan biosynthesis protein ExoA
VSAPSDDAVCTSTASVLVVIPCLDEEAHIEEIVTKLAVEAPRNDLHVVISDGGSLDQTRKIARRLSASNPRITLMDNPKRIQAAAVNLAVKKFGGKAKFLIRVDAHASYPENYCETLLNVQAHTKADAVVVTMHTVGRTCLQRAAAAAQNSVLGNGGSAHRNHTSDRWVDHGHHALMRIDAFVAVGGYDEGFSHNEDAELDARLIEKGHRIYLTSAAPITYFPRGSIVGLFRQYFNIGRGRARNLLKHRKNIRLRHLVLVAVAPALCLLPMTPLASAFATPAVAWAFLCIASGIVVGAKIRDRCAMLSGFAAMAMQAGWSFGFLRQLASAGLTSMVEHKHIRQGQIAR